MDIPLVMALAVAILALLGDGLLAWALWRITCRLAEDNRRKDDTIAAMKDLTAKRYVDRRQEQAQNNEKPETWKPPKREGAVPW